MQIDIVPILKMMILQSFGFEYIGPIGENSNLFLCMIQRKLLLVCSNKDPVPANLQSHVIYQFECPRCKAK